MDITVDLYGETGIVDATDQTTTADTNHLVNKQPEKSYFADNFPSVCRDANQFKAWQVSRPWLKMAASGSVMCESCNKVQHIGMHAVKGQHIEEAFTKGKVTHCRDAKTLLKKIDRHKFSIAHEKCVDILKKNKKLTR